jgi:hypothetical protein
VNAKVVDGVVTLTGRVTMPYSDDIMKRVADVDGVREVRDNIRFCRSRSSTTGCGPDREAIYGNRISGTTPSDRTLPSTSSWTTGT